MLRLPHSVEFGVPADPGYTYQTVRAQVTPMTQAQAFNVAGVEDTDAYMVIVAPSSADAIQSGGRMRFNGKVFAVRTNPSHYSGIGVADHASTVVVLLPGGDS